MDYYLKIINMRNNKTIKVLLIDDTPHYAMSTLDKLSNIKNLIGDTGNLEQIPWVSNQRHSLDPVVWKKLHDAHVLFELRWLQFSTDVFEYRNLTYEIKMKWGIKKLSEVGFIPDIIVFDYALTDDLSLSEYLITFSNLNKYINPTCNLASFIKKEENREVLLPRDTGYNKKAPIYDIIDANNDSFGLFCGGLISEMFKYDIPVAAIPATRKSGNAIKGEPYPAFFEWILDDSYNKFFKERTERRTDKNWDSILTDGLRLYREEIKKMIEIGKIHVDLENILSLLNGNFLKDSDDSRRTEQYFIFSSEYGKRELPLEGLFIDQEITEATTIPDELNNVAKGRKITVRDVEIWNFMNDVINTILNCSEISQPDIKDVIEITDKLIKTFDSVDFKRRMLLSFYYGQVQDNIDELLSDDDKENYKKILTYYTVKDGRMLNTKEFSLSILGSKGRNSNKIKNKLVTFFMATILWKRYLDFIDSLDDNSPENKTTVALEPPKKEDLILSLFPIWTTHIILFEEGGGFTKSFSDAVNNKIETLCGPGFLGKEIKGENGLDLRPQMSFGEFIIVKSFATSLNFKHLPFWLDNYYGYEK
jgi:hypothetical protein